MGFKVRKIYLRPNLTVEETTTEAVFLSDLSGTDRHQGVHIVRRTETLP